MKKNDMQTKEEINHLVCPQCHIELTKSENNLVCNSCHKSFPVKEGIPCFCSLDNFYEGKWAKTDFSNGSLKNYLVKKERFFMKILKNKKGSILDLGCGGGWKFYTRIGNVTGVDLSLQSLKQAKNIYNTVVQSNLNSLPFPDNYFDFVVSSDLIGHLPFEIKDNIIQEIIRVLKKDGLTIHYIETDGNDPIMNWAKKYPDLYDKYIIKPDGHISMETPLETFKRFRKSGLKPIKEIPAYRGLTYAGRLQIYFDNEYTSYSKKMAALMSLIRITRKTSLTETMANLAITGLIEIGDIITPSSWAGGVMVCYKKH